MVIILPIAIDGLANLERKLDPTLLRDILQKVGKANRTEVDLGIPKFKMEVNYKLERSFQSWVLFLCSIPI